MKKGGQSFQFTLPHRERRKLRLKWAGMAMISIHAPAQGATKLQRLGLRNWKFQFTLPHRERRLKTLDFLLMYRFQFTLPHRERRRAWTKELKESDFNSRSRTGSDRGVTWDADRNV